MPYSNKPKLDFFGAGDPPLIPFSVQEKCMVMQKHDFPQRNHDSQIDYHAIWLVVSTPLEKQIYESQLGFLFPIYEK